MVEPINGTCYEDAWRFLIKEEEGELIHGTIESLGRRIGHAWVELPTGYIWEPQTKSYFSIKDFDIAASPLEEHRYTVEEAAIMLSRVGKHGPWIKEEREQFLKGGNPEEVPAVPEVTANLEALSKFVDRENMWVSGSYATGKATAVSDLDMLVGVTDDVFNEPMGLRLRDIEDDIWKTLPKADVFFYNLTNKNKVLQIPAFTKPGGIVESSIVKGLWEDAKLIREVAIPKPPAVEVPAVPEVPTPEVERAARIKYFRGEEAKWRETAYKIAEEEKGEAPFAEAIRKADEFGRQAAELEAKPLAVEEVKLGGGNPTGKVITKEEAIGLLERLSMTPGEAARSLVADEAERREIMQTVQQRVKREQNKWAPMDPREGPPLPRIFAGLRWPWKK